jgi:hypothetical protein
VLMSLVYGGGCITALLQLRVSTPSQLPAVSRAGHLSGFSQSHSAVVLRSDLSRVPDMTIKNEHAVHFLPLEFWSLRSWYSSERRPSRWPAEHLRQWRRYRWR